jgi:hypothetical protein
MTEDCESGFAADDGGVTGALSTGEKGPRGVTTQSKQGQRGVATKVTGIHILSLSLSARQRPSIYS